MRPGNEYIMKITETKDGVTVKGISNLDIYQTFDCGQCFRFDPDPDGGISGVAFGRFVRFEQPEPDTLLTFGATAKEFEDVWAPFLDLGRDYGEYARAFASDPTLSAAALAAGGIRILRQDPWETLCSFIISQNNNIPRIKSLVERISRTYGDPIDSPRGKVWSFPTAKRLAQVPEEEIFALRTGFRARYIADAARRVASGDISLQDVAKLSTKEAEAELCRIKGVGPKVAACSLLFGFGRGDAFPVDVWVRRVLDEYYPGGFDIAALGDMAGIAQQSLFYYSRYALK